MFFTKRHHTVAQHINKVGVKSVIDAIQKIL